MTLVVDLDCDANSRCGSWFRRSTKSKLVITPLVFLLCAGCSIYDGLIEDAISKTQAASVQMTNVPALHVIATALPGTVVPPSSGLASPTATMPVPGEGLFLDIGTQVINLADPGGRRYLKVSIVLEFLPIHRDWYTTLAVDQKAMLQRDFEDDMTARKSSIRELIATIIIPKRFEEVNNLDGKEVLRKEIIQRVNESLGSQVVLWVYFGDFRVQ